MPDNPLLRGLLSEAVVILAALAFAWLVHVVLRRLAVRLQSIFLSRLTRVSHRAWIVTLVVVAVFVSSTRWLGLHGAAAEIVPHILLIATLISVAWLLLKVLFVVEDAAFQWLRVDVANNRRVRRIRTQVAVLRRFTTAVVILVALAAILMTFDQLRALGASLLASAGVFGAVAGFAAHATLGNVFAGLQLAITDQLRYDDVVVVQNEWGRIEELTLTHVVLRLWDERRLVLPTTYFTTNPFQNWTRNEARVVGSVILHLGYNAPVAELRTEARRIIEASPLWDGREWVLQVVDSTPLTMVVRVLASAHNAPSSWDLRCEIREKLLKYLQTHYPQSLPRPIPTVEALATTPDGKPMLPVPLGTTSYPLRR